LLRPRNIQPARSGLGESIDAQRSGDHDWIAPTPYALKPRRKVLYPAALLLLREEPRHGYALTKALIACGLGPLERPTVYRALADLEAMGLLQSYEEASNSGASRRVLCLTEEGALALEEWMRAMAQERNGLDGLLHRYSRPRGEPDGAAHRAEPSHHGRPVLRRQSDESMNPDRQGRPQGH
jgi:PadR family transcriptional regulator, regulatory protein PadR